MGCETGLVAVHCLAPRAMTIRDRWEDLRKEPVDWLNAWMARVWDGSLVMMNCLKV
jgi:hypothetical protein